MSLSWQTSATSLIQRGFSVGDIATLAGAGRAVVTWMTAKSKDGALLEFLDGLIDVVGLQARWGKNLKLFLDGKCRQVQVKPSSTADLSKFSWTLTLISAALHASLQIEDFKNVLTDFTVDLFDDHPSQEYLLHELETHIGGWQSFATIHKIVDAAQTEWRQLARNGHHPVGFIPRSDKPEILRFLRWLAKEKSNKRFETSSSDVYSLALVLQSIGIDDLKAHKRHGPSEPTFEENHIAVVLTTEATNSTSQRTLAIRKGMPIPLDRPEEIIHFWPSQRVMYSNKLQDLFIMGKAQGKQIKFTIEGQASESWLSGPEASSRDFSYAVNECDSSTFQLNGALGPVADAFFPVLFDDTRKVLLAIAREAKWNPPIDNSASSKQAICDNKDFHAMLQSLVLGYWYGALAQLVDTSRMVSTEAFGSWGWWDYEPLEVISWLKKKPFMDADTPMGDKNHIWRFHLLRAAAYLFAGAPKELIERVDNRTTGVVAKLCILSASMLGLSTSRAQAGTFYLLDIDGTCIPNRQGIVLSGRTAPSSKAVAEESFLEPLNDTVRLQGCSEDFTAHIEPDWAHDRQTSLICFRSKGRIVQRLSPLDCDIQAMTYDTRINEHQPRPCVINIDEPESPKAYIVPIDRFYGAAIMTHQTSTALQSVPPLLIPTQDLPRARTCLLTMYSTVLSGNGSSPRYPYQPPETLKDSLVLYDEQTRPILLV